ncbi:MAG: sulfatase [Spirochaetaceae bacterium]
MKRHPNLLFIYTDEQRFDTLAAYGNSTIRMPAVNALAEDSHVFLKTYVTQPVCTPSRSSLMTGLWPHQNGLVGNNIALKPDTRCFPELLEAGGSTDYVSGHFGKWHLGDEIYQQHGFQEWGATEDTYFAFYGPERNQDKDRSAYDRWLRAHGATPVNWVSGVPGVGERCEFRDRFTREHISALPEHLGRPAFLAESAREFITKHRHEPFALFVNFLEPHMPFHGPRDNEYSPASVGLPPDFALDELESLSNRDRRNAVNYKEYGFEGHDLRNEADWRSLNARYWGLCSQVDAAVGRILKALSDEGLYDDTIVVFTSDHGDMMGGHALLGKGTQYDGSTRVPLLIKQPDQRGQILHADPVSHIDLVPTLLDMMGADPNQGLPGSTWRPDLAAGKSPSGDVFVEWNPKRFFDVCRNPEASEADCTLEYIRTIVTADLMKLNWSSSGEHQLFDLAQDPAERRNCIADREQAGRIRELVSRIQAWQENVADEAVLPSVETEP